MLPYSVRPAAEDGANTVRFASIDSPGENDDLIQWLSPNNTSGGGIARAMSSSLRYLPTFEIWISRVLFRDAVNTVPKEVTDRFDEVAVCPT